MNFTSGAFLKGFCWSTLREMAHHAGCLLNRHMRIRALETLSTHVNPLDSKLTFGAYQFSTVPRFRRPRMLEQKIPASLELLLNLECTESSLQPAYVTYE